MFKGSGFRPNKAQKLQNHATFWGLGFRVIGSIWCLGFSGFRVQDSGIRGPYGELAYLMGSSLNLGPL